MQADWIVGSIFTVSFTELLCILGACGESVLKALYIIFIGENQCLYEESECDFYFHCLIVTLYCIMRFCVSLLLVFILCILAGL